MKKKSTCTIPAYLNPLLFEIKKGPVNQSSMATSLFQFLSEGVYPEDVIKVIQERRQRLQPYVTHLKVVPCDKRLNAKLVAPLRQAYAAFLLGNFLGTLALCGLISEMLTIFRFEIARFQVNGHDMTVEDQEGIFGKRFERLGQDRRISILETYGVINNEVATSLRKIYKIRNRYMHYWTKEHDALENDTFQALLAVIDSLLRIFPQYYEKGAMQIHPEILRYFERKETNK